MNCPHMLTMDGFYYSFRAGIARRYRSGTINNETFRLLGCTISQFRGYIDRRRSPGMTPANYGTVWTIGYILSEAEAGSSKKRIHYKNFYPLFRKDPKKKNSRTIIPDNVHKHALTRVQNKRIIRKLGITMDQVVVACVCGQA